MADEKKTQNLGEESRIRAYISNIHRNGKKSSEDVAAPYRRMVEESGSDIGGYSMKGIGFYLETIAQFSGYFIGSLFGIFGVKPSHLEGMVEE